MKRILTIVLFAVVLLLFASTSEAGRPRLFRFWSPSRQVHKHESVHRPHKYHANRNEDYRDLYPKYYYGFHVRHFNSFGFGLPGGDVQVRGFAW